MTQASPIKLRNGNWGAKARGAVREGDEIRITTKAGKTWTAIVAKVVWSGNGVAICATENSGGSRPRRASNGECQCGACDDLLSFGFRPGQRIRCEECGGWAEAW